MVIDKETFTELAVHLKMASDAVLQTAHNMAVIGNTPSSNSQEEAAWSAAIDSMMAVNNQITAMERILRAVLDANMSDPPGSLPN